MSHPSLLAIEIGHPIEDPLGASRDERGAAIPERIVASPHEAPHAHAGGLGGLHPADAILDDERAPRVGSQARGGPQEQVRSRLAALHHLGGEYAPGEKWSKTSQIEAKPNTFEIARGGQAIGRREPSQHLLDPGYGP